MKLFRRAVSAVVAATAMAVLAPGVRADIYGTSYFSGAFGVEMKGNQYSNTQAGTFTTYLANNAAGIGAVGYTSYCIDLKHYTAAGTFNPLDYTPTQLPYTDTFAPNASNMLGNTTWDRAGMGRAAWLVNTFDSTLTTNEQRGLLQVAIWKVVYSGAGDTAAQYKDVTQGSEYTTSLTTAQNNIINGFLTASVNAGGGSTYATAKALWVNFKDVTGNHVQFQIIGAPEPSTLALAGLGLLGFVGYARRRNRLA